MITFSLTSDLVARLESEAERRGVRVGSLVRTVMEIVVSDDLFEAVLADEEIRDGWRQCTASPDAVLAALAESADESGRVLVNGARLAAELRISAPTLVKRFDALESEGRIERVTGPSIATGTGAKRIYRIIRGRP